MKPSEIRAGATYRNRGKGNTMRKVLGIGPEFAPDDRWSSREGTDEFGVLYEQVGVGRPRALYLSAFAAWAGSEVKA